MNETIPTIRICAHCREFVGRGPSGAKFCNDCRLKDQRVEHCTENRKISPNYICRLDCLGLRKA